MAKELCGRCAELLPEIETGEGECPQCGLGYGSGSFGVLHSRPRWNNRPLTGEKLRAWKQGLADEAVARVSGARFPPLGLRSWEGSRWVGGNGSSTEKRRFGIGSRQVIHTVELIHGAREGSPRAEVTTVAKLRDHPGFTLHTHLETLTVDVWHAEHERLDVVQAVARGWNYLELFDPVRMTINRAVVDAHYIKMGASNVVIAETSDLIVSVVSEGLDPTSVELVDADLSRYNDVWDRQPPAQS